MKSKRQSYEFLSRREFFKRTAQKTLLFMADISLFFLFGNEDNEPINNAGMCTERTNSCPYSGSDICMDNCENEKNNNSSGYPGYSNNYENSYSRLAQEDVRNIGYAAIDVELSTLWASTNKLGK